MIRTATLTLLLTACSRPAEPARRVVDLGDVAMPSHEEFTPRPLAAAPFTDDSALGQPGSMLWRNGLLWVVDYAGAPWLHAFDPATGARIWSGGDRGEGPGQFGFVNGIAINHAAGGLWVFDANALRFTAIDTSTRAGMNPHIVAQQERVRINRAIAIADGRFLGLQMQGRDSGRVVVLDTTGGVVTEQPWPLLGGDSVPAESRLLASGASFGVVLCAHPDGRRVALTYSAAGRIDFFDTEGRPLLTADVPFPTDAVFRQVADGRIRPSRPRFFYGDCAATPTRLYALFSGKREADHDPPYYAGADFLHVFDWDGNLVEVLALDVPLAAIAVDSADRRLFGVPIGEARIVQFELRAPR